MTDIAAVDPKRHIIIQGAHLHNLRNIDVVIPRNRLVVITGLSGSGKSTLAFDTLYAEGQRRYVESLSSYARQFLGKLDKPKVDSIKGIAPAIAIEQKVNSTNPRSTVGTSTEIYDYLKLLYARIGRIISPVSGEEVRKHTVSDVVDHVLSSPEGSKLLLLSPITLGPDTDIGKLLAFLSKQGYARVRFEGTVYRIDEVPPAMDGPFELVVDRIVKASDEDFINRLSAAVDSAFFEGKGHCTVHDIATGTDRVFSNRLEADGMEFPEPNVHLFSFNNPYGACPTCEGYGDVMGIDPDLVIPNTSLSVFEGAIAPWKGDSMGHYKEKLIETAYQFDFPIHKPWFELDSEQKKLVWKGNAHFTGLDRFFKKLEAKSYKIQNRVMLSRYRGRAICPDCGGKRLRKEAEYIQVGHTPITELVTLPVDRLLPFFENLELTEYEHKVADRLLKEIVSRLRFLQQVGLGYLDLNRKSNTLSGGESQRINLATSLGSSLVGSLYILDEPSIGLHPRDNENLIEVLLALRDLGNTVIVVEHDEDIMKAADEIIDIGPEAGTQGGQVVAQGDMTAIMASESLTAAYLSGRESIEVPKTRRPVKHAITIEGAREHNLKNLDVTIPLGMLVGITGVSGSGKTTLVRKILYPALLKALDGFGDRPGEHSGIRGDLDRIGHVEFIDQNPIGRSSRSNPVTYTKAYDDIRNLFAAQALSKLRGYQAKHFSFNVDGGRCDKCKGEGTLTVEMQFMADVQLVCDACGGKRFKKELLEVRFEGQNVHDILCMTIDDAIAFFDTHGQKRLVGKLKPLQDVGLGYVTLGQSSSTLSGGEAQRIKLASFLAKGDGHAKTLFIFDEPTTGLHFHDIRKLLKAFEALIAKGHSVVVIEHNLDLIKCADHLIDLGPEGGENGGHLVSAGTPETVARNADSHTGRYLQDKLMG